MSRPTLPIILKATIASSGYEQVIQIVPKLWQLTYNGKLAKIRCDHTCGFKYKKSCWATKQTALTQVAKLRKLYKDDGFGLIEIEP
jgi:hypothetical protein